MFVAHNTAATRGNFLKHSVPLQPQRCRHVSPLSVHILVSALQTESCISGTLLLFSENQPEFTVFTFSRRINEKKKIGMKKIHHELTLLCQTPYFCRVGRVHGMKSRPRRVLRDAHHSPPCLQLSSHQGGGVISDSAERLSCTVGRTGSCDTPGLLDSAVAAALSSHSSDAFGHHSEMEFKG